jgi:hypothetical protein
MQSFRNKNVHYLMSSADEIKVLLLQETGHNLLPKCEGHASIIAAPESCILAVKKNNFLCQHFHPSI